MKKLFLSLFLTLVLSSFLLSQSLIDTVRHKAVFADDREGFYETEIMKSLSPYKKRVPRKYISVETSVSDFPLDPSAYAKYWHTPAQSQGASGTCWAFASTAFLESENYRQGGPEVKFSEMYIVFCEYLERAADFVRTKGNTYFEEGSEANAIVRIIPKYGLMPYEVYSGKLSGQKVHDHQVMIEEMKTYLEYVKQKQLWEEDEVTATIRNILIHYMGEPPATFAVNGKEYTPLTFLSDYTKINPSDYFSFMSTLSLPFGQKGELIEADNWWHCKEYYNISSDDFLELAVQSLKNGYTLCICGDVSEAGMIPLQKACIVPSFDIPSEYIDDEARQFRLSDNSTTDDHCVHIVGYTVLNGKYWFLIKDSGSGAFDGNNKGYRYMHQDYLKLKMMNIMVYKYAASFILDGIIK